MPREGHDTRNGLHYVVAGIFLSTCPVRGTTLLSVHGNYARAKFLSTCPVRGTTGYIASIYNNFAISIHVPREGHDPPGSHAAARCGSISIHVPREGHDRPSYRARSPAKYFYPRAP